MAATGVESGNPTEEVAPKPETLDEAAELIEINRKIAEVLKKSMESTENTKKYLANIRSHENGDTVKKCLPFMDEEMRQEMRGLGKEARACIRPLHPDSVDLLKGTVFEKADAKVTQSMDRIEDELVKIVDDSFEVPKYNEVVEQVIEETKHQII